MLIFLVVRLTDEQILCFKIEILKDMQFEFRDYRKRVKMNFLFKLKKNLHISLINIESKPRSKIFLSGILSNLICLSVLFNVYMCKEKDVL